MELIERQTCGSAHPWVEVSVPSKTQKDKSYRVMRAYPEDPMEELICECPGYLYRGRCSHQDLAVSLLCCWAEVYGPEKQTPEQKVQGICPRCGGPTVRIDEWE